MSDETKRPSRTSMEGMIWNANHILELALKPGINGLPKNLFQDAVGIVIISVVQAGFMFSGSVGTGILLEKNEQGKWSKPVATGVTGVGFGLLIGASVKDMVVFILDDISLKQLAYDCTGLKIGSQLEATLGPIGRAMHFDFSASKQGVAPTLTVAYAKGAFVGLSIDGAVLGHRPKVNEVFYGKPVTPKEILSGEVEVPTDRVTLLSEVYDKLDKLAAGVTSEPTADDAAKTAAAAEVAEEKAAEVHAQSTDVIEVDAAAEAAKEV